MGPFTLGGVVAEAMHFYYKLWRALLRYRPHGLIPIHNNCLQRITLL